MAHNYKMSIDLETRSRFNLSDGVYGYATDPSTKILCIAYKISKEGEPDYTGIIIPRADRDFLLNVDLDPELSDEAAIFLDAWEDPECELHAWNETFERLLFNWAGADLGIPKVPYRRWHCTMVRAYYYNLPGSLKTCAIALDLEHKKDEAGKLTMLQLCKPRKPSKNNPDEWYTRGRFPEKYEILYEYCIQDVEVEHGISEYLAPIPAMEEELFHLDKEINNTGLYIDLESLKKAQKVNDIYKKELVDSFEDLTGVKPSRVSAYREYVLETYGIELQNLQAATVEQIFRHPEKYPEEFIKELEIYSQATKRALTKLKKFKNCMTADKRIHGTLQFYGAPATGRWAGRLIQPQNLPSRNVYKDMDGLFQDLNNSTPEEFIDLYRERGVIKCLSTCLRGFIIPPPKHQMFMADYSAIEGRVVAWLGDVKDDLDAFRAGRCVYREFAKIVYGMSHEEAHALDKGSSERAVCKEGILSLGYGVGHDKYGGRVFELTNEAVDIRCSRKTCHRDPDNRNRIIHGCEAKRIVQIYRETRPNVTRLWYEMEAAVFSAMKEPNVVFEAGPFKFIKRGIFLHMRLPNGRVLRYPGACVMEVEKWGRLQPQFFYRGNHVGIKTQAEKDDPDFNVYWRLKPMYGAKFFQNAAQAIARDIMAEAMLRVQRSKKYGITLTVHDEIVGIFKTGEGNIKEVEHLMTINPDWCPDLPLAVEGGLIERYRK